MLTRNIMIVILFLFICSCANLAVTEEESVQAVTVEPEERYINVSCSGLGSSRIKAYNSAIQHARYEISVPFQEYLNSYPQRYSEGVSTGDMEVVTQFCEDFKNECLGNISYLALIEDRDTVMENEEFKTSLRLVIDKSLIEKKFYEKAGENEAIYGILKQNPRFMQIQY